MDKPAAPFIIQGIQMPQAPKLWPKTTSASLPKIVFILLSIVIVGELIWGAWYILLSPTTTTKKPKNQNLTLSQSKTTAAISLKTNQTNLKVGDNLNVDVLLSTNDRATTGTDLIIKYDPNFLSLSNNSFTKGSIYDEYLGQTVSNNKGIFRVSGLSVNTSQKITNGIFGSLGFKVLASGNTKVTVDFKPGASNDSNIIDSKLSKDILDKVDNLEVIIK